MDHVLIDHSLEYISTLEDRLKALENRSDSIHQQPQTSLTVLYAGSDESGPSPHKFLDEGRSIDFGNTAADTQSPQEQIYSTDLDSIQVNPDSNDMTDKIGPLILETRNEGGYFGPSSNVMFLRCLLDAMFSNVSQEHFEPESGATSPKDGTSGSEQEYPINLYSFPSNDRAHQLMDGYFNNIHPLCPYIDEEEVRESSRLAYIQGFRQTGRTWLALMNMIFAMALQTANCGLSMSSLRGRLRESNRYYQRANALFSIDILTANSLEASKYVNLSRCLN